MAVQRRRKMSRSHPFHVCTFYTDGEVGDKAATFPPDQNRVFKGGLLGLSPYPVSGWLCNRERGALEWEPEQSGECGQTGQRGGLSTKSFY